MTNYTALYDAWKREKEHPDIQPLTENFHTLMMGYTAQLREQSKIIDKSSLSGKIIDKEREHVQRMLKEINQIRLRKLVVLELDEKPVDVLNLTAEEKRLQVDLRRLLATYNQSVKHMITGRELIETNSQDLAPIVQQAAQTLPNIQPAQQPVQAKQPQIFKTIRFIQPIPAIMGVDMKTYGPFKTEEIASIPLQNAENLIRKGIAKEVEIPP